jgi:hypothetical protein
LKLLFALAGPIADDCFVKPLISVSRAAIIVFCSGLFCLQMTRAQVASDLPTTRIYDGHSYVLRPPRVFSDLCKITLQHRQLQAELKFPKDDEPYGELAYGDFVLNRGRLAAATHSDVFEFQPIANFVAHGRVFPDRITIAITPAGTQILFRRNGDIGSESPPVFTFTQGVVVNGRATVHMIISPRPDHPGGPNVVPVRQDWQDDDFGSFVNNHPDITAECLLPLFKDFQLDYLLIKPTEWQLAQMFPDLFKPDDATIKEVKALLDKLDSESWADRQAATLKLKDMGPIAAGILVQIDPRSLSPEQQARVAVLCEHRLTKEQISELSKNTDLLLECMDDQRPEVRAEALAALKKAIGHDVAFDLDSDAAKRRTAIETLRDQLRPATRP